MNLFRIKSYLAFLFRSTNQHGIHSPFVYRLVTCCFYKKSNINEKRKYKHISNKKQRNNYLLLERFCRYMNYNTYCHIGWSSCKIPALENLVAVSYPSIKKTDLIYIEHIEDFSIIDNVFTQMHNDSAIIVNQPYASPERLNQWKKLQTMKEIRVCIDCFDIGFLFIRKEQVPEKFTVRL